MWYICDSMGSPLQQYQTVSDPSTGAEIPFYDPTIFTQTAYTDLYQAYLKRLEGLKNVAREAFIAKAKNLRRERSRHAMDNADEADDEDTEGDESGEEGDEKTRKKKAHPTQFIVIRKPVVTQRQAQINALPPAQRPTKVKRPKGHCSASKIPYPATPAPPFLFSSEKEQGRIAIMSSNTMVGSNRSLTMTTGATNTVESRYGANGRKGTRISRAGINASNGVPYDATPTHPSTALEAHQGPASFPTALEAFFEQAVSDEIQASADTFKKGVYVANAVKTVGEEFLLRLREEYILPHASEGLFPDNGVRDKYTTGKLHGRETFDRQAKKNILKQKRKISRDKMIEGDDSEGGEDEEGQLITSIAPKKRKVEIEGDQVLSMMDSFAGFGTSLAGFSGEEDDTNAQRTSHWGMTMKTSVQEEVDIKGKIYEVEAELKNQEETITTLKHNDASSEDDEDDENEDDGKEFEAGQKPLQLPNPTNEELQRKAQLYEHLLRSLDMEIAQWDILGEAAQRSLRKVSELSTTTSGSVSSNIGETTMNIKPAFPRRSIAPSSFLSETASVASAMVTEENMIEPKPFTSSDKNEGELDESQKALLKNGEALAVSLIPTLTKACDVISVRDTIVLNTLNHVRNFTQDNTEFRKTVSRQITRKVLPPLSKDDTKDLIGTLINLSN